MRITAKTAEYPVQPSPTIALALGSVYSVDDVLGHICFHATYRGILEDENTYDQLLLFERVMTLGETGSRWCGIVPQVTTYDNHQLRIRLVAEYYGKTFRSLKKWDEIDKSKPKWIKQS